MRLELEIRATVAIDYDPAKYPAGMTAQEALALELEQATTEPAEYLSMPNAAFLVTGQVAADA